MMRMKNAAFFVVLVTIYGVAFKTVKAHMDPCKDSKDLPLMTKRLAGYSLASGEKPFCDHYLPDGWYKMGSYVLASKPSSCGTTISWYMEDPLPTGGPADRQVCRSGGSNCSRSKTIQVKKCGGKYVFKLKHLDGCAEGYCVEATAGTPKAALPPPDISMLHPSVSVELEYITRRGDDVGVLRFYCDFDPKPSMAGYYYQVDWSLTSGLSLTKSLHQSLDKQYTTKAQFRRHTVLKEETHLKDQTIYAAGFTLVCSVTAKADLTGRYSNYRISNKRFVGIQVENADGEVQIKNEETRVIQLRLTVPFGCPKLSGVRQNCSLDVNTFVPPDAAGEECRIPNLAMLKNDINGCGVRLYNSDIDKPVDFNITTKQGYLLTTGFGRKYELALRTIKFESHDLFSNYALVPVGIAVLSDTRSFLSGKVCSAHSDPHMVSFDGRTFECQEEGTFILYRNVNYREEVHMKTTKCWKGSTPKCICGMAVRAGKDVFVINLCSGESEIRYRRCEDKILKGKVKRDNNIYIVYLPTGTEVHMQIHDIYSGPFIEVEIHPSLVDIDEADGLCGEFDNNQGNDLSNRKGVKGDHNLSWKVRLNENLFDENNYDSLRPVKELITLCGCTANLYDAMRGILMPETTCDGSMKKTCHNDNHKDVPNAMCELKGRKKRSDTIANQYDMHFDTETDNDFADVQHYVSLDVKNHKRAVIDPVSARRDCLDMMNTTLFQMCSALPDINIHNAIDDCVADAVASGSMDWTRTHIEGARKKCLHHVDINQPIPSEVLAKIELLNYTDVLNETNSTNSAPNSSVAIPENIFTPKLLKTMKEISCPNECSGHGTCIQGKCVCEREYINFDCSIRKSTPPQIKGIPDRGKCDLRLRKCGRTSVLGRFFVESPSLTCKVTPYYLDRNNEPRAFAAVSVGATFESPVEVNCVLPGTTRTRRSVSGVSGDETMARYFKVSVSNDNKSFSSEDTIVIFDSQCVNCSKINGKVFCSVKPGYCMKDEQCFKTGEGTGCYTCLETQANKATWTSGSDCPILAPPPEEKNTLWIIAAVIGPLVVVIVIVILLWCCCLKKKSPETQDVNHMNPVFDTQYNKTFKG